MCQKPGSQMQQLALAGICTASKTQHQDELSRCSPRWIREGRERDWLGERLHAQRARRPRGFGVGRFLQRSRDSRAERKQFSKKATLREYIA